MLWSTWRVKCPWAVVHLSFASELNEKSLMVMVAAAAEALNFQTLLRQENMIFFLHFMVCWIFCFSCYIAGIMFMALEYSCGFPNASDLIWHLPHAQKFIASYTLSLWRLSLPQLCGGVLETDNDPVELFLSWWEALLGASADSDRTRRQLLMGRRGQPRPLALAWAPNTHLRK